MYAHIISLLPWRQASLEQSKKKKYTNLDHLLMSDAEVISFPEQSDSDRMGWVCVYHRPRPALSVGHHEQGRALTLL